MGNINKGTIASISGNTARVVPSDAGAKPTAKITIPWHHRAECESEHRLEVRQENNQHSGQKGRKKNDQSRRLCEADRQQVRNRPEDTKLGKTTKA